MNVGTVAAELVSLDLLASMQPDPSPRPHESPQGKETLVTILIPTPRPIVAAPMAGGPTTVALVLAVAEAGSFPFLAGGYKTAEALHAEIQQLQAKDVPFGVNIFVPSNATVDPAVLSAYADELAPEAEHYGLQLDPPAPSPMTTTGMTRSHS